MECRISFKHMKRSQAIVDYTESKIIPKIEKFATKPIDARVTFSAEAKSYSAHCHVIGGDGLNCQIEFQSHDMYSAIDTIVDKLEALLKKQKEKIKDHKNHSNLKHLALAEYTDEFAEPAIDAEDLIKYEKARMRATG